MYFPSRTNRKSGSPITHIATANVEAAEICCRVNAKIADSGWIVLPCECKFADFGWVACRGFIKRREQSCVYQWERQTPGGAEDEQNL